MSKARRSTVSILGAFVFFGAFATLAAWCVPFFLFGPDKLVKMAAKWSAFQCYGYFFGTGIGAGIAAAAFLLLLRSILPARFRSRIVWVPPEFFDRALILKRGIELTVVAIIMIGGTLFVHYGPPRFWGNFTGMSEGEVRQRLGQPFRDSRHNNNEREYTLGWYQGFEVGLFLEFRDGVVISQERVNR
jgi:hypothetical protein